MDTPSNSRHPMKGSSKGEASHVCLSNFSDRQWEPERLISSIQSHLKERLGTFATISSNAEYILMTQIFPDEVMDLLKLLSQCDIESHGCLWLLTVGEVIRTTLAVTLYANDSPDPTTQLSYAMASMLPVSNELCLYLENLVKLWDLEAIQQNMGLAADKLKSYFYRTLGVACDWLTKCPRLIHDEKCLTVIAQRINEIHQMQPEASQAAIFPVLASFSRAAFICGCSKVVLQIDEKVASVSHATALLLQFKIDFNALMDFCRYFGYCLVTCVVIGNTINQKLCNRADVLLTSLLGLPNLRLANYVVRQSEDTPVGTPNQTSERYISVKGREELSFFYIINSLLRMKLLAQFVTTSERFQSECDFLLNSLHSRESQALDILASAPHSHNPSVVSLPNFEIQARNVLSSYNSRVMSSILEDGTYKEKLILVLSFFQHLKCESRNGKESPVSDQLVKLVQTFCVDGLLQNVDLRTKLANDDIILLINKINKVKYPGKMVFVEALHKIVCLCELLFAKHAFTTMNIKSEPSNLLSQVFQTLIPLTDVMNVKSLMVLNDRGELECCSPPMLLEDAQVKEFSRCLQRVTMLELQF